MTRLIGLIGRAGAGKDTVADQLCVSRGYRKRSLAEPLREMAATLTGWPMEAFLDRDLKERLDPVWKKSPRQVLQLLGTQGVRASLGEDAFILSLQQWWENRGRPRLVVPDVRFANEAKAIEGWGGQLWLITRLSASEKPVFHESEEMAAALELAMQRPSWATWPGMQPLVRLENNGTLADLQQLVGTLAV